MKKRTILIALIFSVSGTFATDGYFSNGYGTQNKGLAGSGIAYLNSAAASIMNPAGPAFMGGNGFKFEVALSLFNPNREYTISGAPTPPQNWGYFDNNGNFVTDGRFMALGLTPGTVESENPIFFVPMLAASYTAGQNVFLLNVYGNGGMNTEYDAKTFYSSTIDQMFQGSPQNFMANVRAPSGVNLEQLFVSAGYTRKITENHALGLSPVFAYQTFEATGLQAFRDMGMAGANGGSLTNNGKSTSTGFGFKLGYQGEIMENLRLGLAYQSEIDMSAFDEYKGLFAEEGDFDIPANWTAGISYTVGKITLMADVKEIQYSSVKAIANGLDPAKMLPMVPDVTQPASSNAFVANPNFAPLGSENGAGFGWDDMTIVKLGCEYAATTDWIWRGGFSFGKQPISEEAVIFNILAPAVNENHFSFGATKNLGGNALSVAITHAFSNTVKGSNPFDPAQTIELKMNQWDFDLGFAF